MIFTITAQKELERWEFDMENENMAGHWTGIFSQKNGQTEIDFTEDVTVFSVQNNNTLRWDVASKQNISRGNKEFGEKGRQLRTLPMQERLSLFFCIQKISTNFKKLFLYPPEFIYFQIKLQNLLLQAR